MDTISLFFVALIILLGGLIAYMADLFGRSLGKKRLSIFGIRPKYTAAILTTLAGLLIPLATVLILVGMSREVRVWLAEGQSAVKEKDKKVQELQLMSGKVQRKTEEIIQLEKKNQLESQKLADAQKKVSELEKTASALGKQTHLLRAQVRDYQKSVIEIRQRYASLSKNHTLLQADSRELKTIKDKLATELKEKELQSQKLEQRIASLVTRVQDINKQKEEIAAQFDIVNDQFHEELNRRRAELEETKLAKDKAQSEIGTLQQLKMLLESSLDQSARRTRLMPLIFYQGEELARVPVEAGLDAKHASLCLKNLLVKADFVALQKGARAKLGTNLYAGFELLPMNDRLLTVEEQETAVQEGIRDLIRKNVLIAYAFWNTYKDEYVILDIRKYPNPLVYKAGQTVAEIFVDGSNSENIIIEQISTLLKNKIESQAQKDGMIPIGNHQDKFVNLSYGDMLKLVKRIRYDSKSVRICAAVRKDTYAADPLELEFHLDDSK